MNSVKHIEVLNWLKGVQNVCINRCWVLNIVLRWLGVWWHLVSSAQLPSFRGDLSSQPSDSHWNSGLDWQASVFTATQVKSSQAWSSGANWNRDVMFLIIRLEHLGTNYFQEQNLIIMRPLIRLSVTNMMKVTRDDMSTPHTTPCFLL